MRFRSAAYPVGLFYGCAAVVLLMGALFVGILRPFPFPDARSEPEKPAAEDAAPLADDETRLEVAKARASVAEFSRILGSEAEGTLAARRVLATALRNAWFATGDDELQREDEAERRALLAIVERLHGQGDPATFPDWKSLALDLLLQQRYGEAGKEYRGLIVAMGKGLGPEDEETLESREFLAGCLHDDGKYAEAEREYRALSALRERVPGTRGQSVRELRATLAGVLDDGARHAEAEAEHRLFLTALEEETRDTRFEEMPGRVRLAECLLSQSKGAEAIRELEFVEAQGGEFIRCNADVRERVSRLLADARKALAALDEKPGPAPAQPE